MYTNKMIESKMQVIENNMRKLMQMLESNAEYVTDVNLHQVNTFANMMNNLSAQLNGMTEM